MSKTIEFMYDFGSPNAYLVHRVLPGLARRHKVGLEYVPILLGGVFKATGNQSPIQAFADVKNKLDYQNREIDRFVARHKLPFAWNPHFPVMTIGVMRGAVFARGKSWERKYIDTVFDATWVQGKKMDDPKVIVAVLTAAGLPADEIMAAAQDAEIKQELIDNTYQAVQSGAFGSPTMFVGDEMFFGKDSLSDLDYELSH